MISVIQYAQIRRLKPENQNHLIIDSGYSRVNPLNYYPLNNNDYWEFIEIDTATIGNQFYDNINFSVTKDILYDTLMSNGITYKKIKWENEANSINYPTEFEFHRTDSTGNVYLFYQNNDFLLFDVTANVGDTSPSYIPGFQWELADRYQVIFLGDTLAALDFNLLEDGTILTETYTLVENYGLVRYGKNLNGIGKPEGNIWGAVIDGKEHGHLIANREVDWSNFYPLHIGDYWVYQGISGSIPFIETHRIIADTLMPDGNTYFNKDNYVFERLDRSGNLYTWSDNLQSPTLKYKFSDIVGDTISDYEINDSFWRVDDKLFNVNTNRFEIYRFLHPDLIYYGEYFDEGLGLYEWTIEGGHGILKGAYINGILFGDTTITKVLNDKKAADKKFVLFQNYPNPFNSTTTISFFLPTSSNITLCIYDILGKKVRELLNEYYTSGLHEIRFNSNNLASGTYFYVLISNNQILTKKMVYLK